MKLLKVIFISIFGGVFFCFGGYVGQYTFEPQVIYQPHYIQLSAPKPEIITNYITKTEYITLTEIVTEYIDRPVIEYVEVIREVEKVVFISDLKEWLIPWKNVTKVREYVRGTGIPDKEYIKTVFDCDDFAISLSLQALLDRRFLGILDILRVNRSGIESHHWKLFTLVNGDIYEVEPQTGNTWILYGAEGARLD